MGMYLNPGNSGFAEKLKTEYVDKTELIGLINRSIETNHKLTCVSRPRRFGKSYAAQMLCAYYDKSCDSRSLFEGLEIERDETYRKHLNKYDVIYLDMTGIKPYTNNYSTLVPFLIKTITDELLESYPDISKRDNFLSTLVDAVGQAGNKCLVIIDEWDAPIRENPATEKEYLEFLRSLFKNSGVTSKIFAAAYMTGILPIKKDGSQSAISDFEEFTVVKPRMYAQYIGFTEEEVYALCTKSGVSFSEMKRWYDGYSFKQCGSIYNPNSVMKAISYNDFDSYWTETSAAKKFMEFITMPYYGLTKTVAELIGGVDVKVDTTGFANDLITFRGREDVLTLLIHLGYLAYDSETKTAHIPNEEIRIEFQKAVREVDHRETMQRLEESDRLFLNTLQRDEEAVAAQIEKVHAEETSPIHYNREESLSSVIKLAYYTYRDNYLQWEELPAGVGYADIVYLPKRSSGWPALVIELKWNESAEGAIEQIRKKRYPDALKGYGGEVLLVGINYDRNAPAGERRHTCRIEADEKDV